MPPLPGSEQQDLSQLMAQLTVNVTSLTNSLQATQTQAEATKVAQEKSDLQMQQMQAQLTRQGEQLTEMGKHLVVASQRDRGIGPSVHFDPAITGELTFTGLTGEYADLTDKPITGRQCAGLIQHALSQHVAPVVTQLHSRLEQVVKSQTK